MNFVTDLLSDITDDLGGQNDVKNTLDSKSSIDQGKLFTRKMESLGRSAPTLSEGGSNPVVEGMGCVQRWYGCSATEDCCDGLQCRVGDKRCLTQDDFNWARNNDHAKGDAGALNRDPSILYRSSPGESACMISYKPKANWNVDRPITGGGGPDDRYNYSTLEAAEEQCNKMSNCKAITKDGFGYNLRDGAGAGPWKGMNSWEKQSTECDVSPPLGTVKGFSGPNMQPKYPWGGAGVSFKIDYGIVPSEAKNGGLVMGPESITLSGATPHTEANGVYTNLLSWGADFPVWTLTPSPPGKIILLSYSNPRSNEAGGGYARWMITSHDVPPGGDGSAASIISNDDWYNEGDLLYGANTKAPYKYQVNFNEVVIIRKDGGVWESAPGYLNPLTKKFGNKLVNLWMPPIRMAEKPSWFAWYAWMEKKTILYPPLGSSNGFAVPWIGGSYDFKVTYNLKSVTQAQGIVMGPSSVTISGANEYPEANGVYSNLRAWGGGVLPAWSLTSSPPGKVIILSYSNPRSDMSGIIGAQWLITSHDLRPGDDSSGTALINSNANWFKEGELLYGANPTQPYSPQINLDDDVQVCNDPHFGDGSDCWNPAPQKEALRAKYPGGKINFWMPPRFDFNDSTRYWFAWAKEYQPKAEGKKTELPSMKNLICPIDFPFMSEDPGVCYNNPKAAAAGSGPCGSWCALGDSSSGSGVEAKGCGWPNDGLMCKNKSKFKSLRYVMLNVANPNSFGGMMIAGEKWRSTGGFSQGGAPAEAKGAPYVWDNQNHMFRATPPEDQYRIWYNGGRHHGPDSPEKSGPSVKGWCVGGGFGAQWQTPGQFLQKVDGGIANRWGSIMYFLPSDNPEDPSGDYVRADEYFKNNPSDMQWVNDLNQNTAWGVLSEIGGISVRKPEPLEGPPHVPTCPSDACPGKDGWYCGGADISGSSDVCEDGKWKDLKSIWGDDWYQQFQIQKSNTLMGYNDMSQNDKDMINQGKKDYSTAEASIKSGAEVIASTKQFLVDMNNELALEAGVVMADLESTDELQGDPLSGQLQDALTNFQSSVSKGGSESSSLSSPSYQTLLKVSSQVSQKIAQDDGSNIAYINAWKRSNEQVQGLLAKYQRIKSADSRADPTALAQLQGQLESSSLKHTASFYGWVLWAGLVVMLVGLTMHFSLYGGFANRNIIVMAIVAVGILYVIYNMYLIALRTKIVVG